MRRFVPALALSFILLTGLLLRVMWLRTVPAGLNWDEAAVGYNAYLLLHTGRDEFSRTWPLFIESFGDFKTGLYSILLVPIISQFGLNIWSVRILNVFVGTATIAASYVLGRAVFKKDGVGPALVMAALMAWSPLTIHLSRFALEWYAALPLFMLGVACLVTPAKWRWQLPLAAFLLGFSLYWYHSVRLVLPLFLTAFAIIYYRQLWTQRRTVILSLLVGLVTILPLGWSFYHSNILARPQAVTIFTNPDHQRFQTENLYRFTVAGVPARRLFANKAVYYGQEVAWRYLAHFSSDFLFFGRDATYRVSIYPLGKLPLVALPFLLIGMVVLVRRQTATDLVILAWVVLSPLPASLTNDAPHGLRSLLLLPALHVVICVGVIAAYKWLKAWTTTKVSANQLKTVLLGSAVTLTAGLFLAQTAVQLADYFVIYPEESVMDWQGEQLELYAKIKDYQDQYDEIIMTTDRGQPHIFTAFYLTLDPSLYQQAVKNQVGTFNARLERLGTFTFMDLKQSDYCRPTKSLVVTTKALDHLAPLTTTTVTDRFHPRPPIFYLYDTSDPVLQHQLCGSATLTPPVSPRL